MFVGKFIHARRLDDQEIVEQYEATGIVQGHVVVTDAEFATRESAPREFENLIAIRLVDSHLDNLTYKQIDAKEGHVLLCVSGDPSHIVEAFYDDSDDEEEDF